MSSTKQAPQFEIGLLLRAAAMVNLDPMDVPGDVNPWQWDDPRAKGWQSAIRVLNPTLADAAEATWGPAMTLGLGLHSLANHHGPPTWRRSWKSAVPASPKNAVTRPSTLRWNKWPRPAGPNKKFARPELQPRNKRAPS
jgi:hypothetical protein